MAQYFTDFKTVSDGITLRGPHDCRPVIGLSVNVADQTSRLHQAYVESVITAGGIPLLIPATVDGDVLSRITELIDGLILTGGADVDGSYFGEPTLTGLCEVDPERDAYDFLLLRLATDRQIPVLGICRGAQVINIAFGGNIWQDIPSQYPGEYLEHSVLTSRESPVHTISIASGSVLESVFNRSTVEVNSRHHQAIKDPAPGFRVTARSADGIIEAVEGYPARRIIGVQWHPENMAAEGDNYDMRELFGFFIREAGLFRKAKELHNKYLTVDSHCDTPMLFGRHDVDFARRDPVAQVDLVKMSEGRLDAVFMVAYIPQGPRDNMGHVRATRQAVGLLRQLKQKIKRNDNHAVLTTNFEQALRHKYEDRKSIFTGIENGYAIGTDIRNLLMFRDMGVTYITLCHNGNNDLCDSASGEPEHGGLSPLGRQTVREMNRLGLVVDLSHCAESTFYDVLEESRTPVICSHSSARALCDHPRNLTDDQIRALAAKEGVIQVCLYEGFLRSDAPATVTDAVDHIDHIIRLVGPAHVGIGSDFDGGGGIDGCRGANELINITVELLRRGYGEEDIAGILGGNLRRVIERIQNMKEE